MTFFFFWSTLTRRILVSSGVFGHFCYIEVKLHLISKKSFMNVLKKVFYYLIVVVSAVLIIVTMSSLIHDLMYWYSEILDFPRTQYLIAGVVLLVIFLLIERKWNFSSILLAVGLVGTIIVQSSFVFPYVLGEKKVPEVSSQEVSPKNDVGLLVANVLMKNRQPQEFLNIVENTDPDMLLVMEVDQWWIKQLEPVTKEYPYRMESPFHNAYGMALYSKFPMEERDVRFFNHRKVPSFHVKVMLPSGNAFRLHAVHPVAPFPSSEYPDNVGNKEWALVKTGEMVAKDSLPSVVAGDFNDVSWSDTSGMFEKTGKLNNVRLGRGLFNTFSAKSSIMRWPLDHFFVSKEFGVVDFERLPKFHSDHFPMYARLQLME
ncbi:MAG: endonuclease/exonuclease/phosphatase family protein [Salegentibacter sp.]